ncbi:MAG: DUF1674 domain-containing protein [Pseudomonadota bacterium]
MTESTLTKTASTKKAQTETAPDNASDAAKKRVKEAGERAKAEAQARRAEADNTRAELPKEVDGRGGLDPARYNDWEIKGLTADF